ncbi:MAG: hypothetical protein R3F34_15335 [Planctomycetota bacterium]
MTPRETTPAAGTDGAEPRTGRGPVVLVDADFRALADPLARDPQFNAARLAARTKLATIGKRAAARIAEDGLALDTRSSIHNPHPFNHMRVSRLWTYLVRQKKDKTKLKRELGPELAKDLDAAYRNAYLCVAIEADAVEVSLRIHADAWIDSTNLTRRIQREGFGELVRVLNRLDGYRLRMHDWKGEWPCETIETSAMEEFLRYWKPGEHRFAIERRWPAPEGARGEVCAEGFDDVLVRELARLVPAYRWIAWSAESDHLFGGS